MAFSSLEDFGTTFDHSPPALFLFVCFEMEIISGALIPLFRPGPVHSGPAR